MKIDSINKLDDFIYLLKANNISLESITINSSEILNEIKKGLSFYYAPQLDKCELNTASYKGVRIEETKTK